MNKVSRLIPALALLLLFQPVRAQHYFETFNNGKDSSRYFSQDLEILDTLPTKDKYVKYIIYNDFSWDYLELDRPVIDTSGFFEGWDSEMIHAFKGEPLSMLPDSLDIRLTDETHPYCSPYRGKVISGFKWRGSHAHNGVDLPLHVGDTIRAAFDGIVRYSGVPGETGGYGNLLVVRHDNGLETYYAHLSSRLVKPDEMVSAGEPIGLGGSTGHSTGPHLHFETRYHGKPFDPERVFDFEAGTVRDTILLLKKEYFDNNSHYNNAPEVSPVKYTPTKPYKPVKPAKPKNVYHKVRQGENLSKIARKYGTTVSAICKLNGIKTSSTIRPGQSLLVKKGR